MQIDIVAPSDLTAEDVAAWRRLQAENPSLASPYLSPDWVLTVAGADGPDRRGAKIAILREDGRAVGFLPLRVGRATARPVGAPMCDYQGLVAAPGVKLDPRRITQALKVSRLDFTHLLSDQAPFRPFMQGRGLSQVVDLSEGYEAYEAERRAGGHGILKDTAKKLRKLEREHGTVEFAALSQSEAEFERLIGWKRAQYRLTHQTDIFETGWTLEVLKTVFGRQDPEFGGALFALRVGGEAVALNFSMRAGKVLHCWFIGHDREFDRYSPGVILIDQILRWAPENGVTEFDMGPGDYRFKMQLANRTREVAHGFVGAVSPAALVRGLQYRVRHLAEALPLGGLSELPGKAMRRLDLWAGLMG